MKAPESDVCLYLILVLYLHTRGKLVSLPEGHRRERVAAALAVQKPACERSVGRPSTPPAVGCPTLEARGRTGDDASQL